jgi:hypothetical protein
MSDVRYGVSIAYLILWYFLSGLRRCDRLDLCVLLRGASPEQ